MKQSERRSGNARSNHPRRGVAALCGLFLAFLLTACASADKQACKIYWQEGDSGKAARTAEMPELKDAMSTGEGEHLLPKELGDLRQLLRASEVMTICEEVGYKVTEEDLGMS